VFHAKPGPDETLQLHGIEVTTGARLPGVDFDYLLLQGAKPSVVKNILWKMVQGFQQELRDVGAVSAKNWDAYTKAVDCIRELQLENQRNVDALERDVNCARMAAQAVETKLLSDLTDANHKALNYKSQRDQALRDNARLRNLLSMLGQQVLHAAAFVDLVEGISHDLPAAPAQPFPETPASSKTEPREAVSPALAGMRAALAASETLPKPQTPAAAVDDQLSEMNSKPGGQ
jgi:hypothetical protein